MPPSDPSDAPAPAAAREPGASPRVALVLDAGGARSAYQVGALEVLLPALAARGERPTVVVGTSAGALIASAVAATAHLDVDEQVAALRELLRRAVKRNVITPLWRQAPEVALRYASETLGLSRFRLRGLLGTTPLARTLADGIDWEALHRNVADGRVGAAAVVATEVHSGRVVLFTEATDAAELPEPSRDHHRRYVATQLDVEHLMASAAIPALFPSVRVRSPGEARGWYVDGATRRRFPLAPAVELGADRVCVVGTGSLLPGRRDDAGHAAVDLADGAATLLGAVMDDPLRHDLRRFASVNLQSADPDIAPVLARHREERDRRPHRVVPYAAVVPHRGSEISDLAMEVFRRNHHGLWTTLTDPDLQVVHRVLGSDSPLQGELLSYLMFDADFFEATAALGRRDAEAWLADDHDDGPWQVGHLEQRPAVG